MTARLSRAFGFVALCLTTVVGLSTLMGSTPARAGSDPTPTVSNAASSTRVRLAVTPTASTFHTGQSPTFRVVVTNQASVACGLVDVADGELQLVSAVRDGTSLSPS